jgi:hypothetical protein
MVLLPRNRRQPLPLKQDGMTNQCPRDRSRSSTHTLPTSLPTGAVDVARLPHSAAYRARGGLGLYRVRARPCGRSFAVLSDRAPSSDWVRPGTSGHQRSTDTAASAGVWHVARGRVPHPSSRPGDASTLDESPRYM